MNDFWLVVLGAVLALAGGMFGQLWTEIRANRSELHALQGEIEGLVAMCDIYLRPDSEISISHYLPQLRSFALHGPADRTWLRAVTDRTERQQVFILYAMASSLVHNLDILVAREHAARDGNDRDEYQAAIKRNRENATEGFRLLRANAEETSNMLLAIKDRPLLT